MRILLTGGAGFVGSHLADALIAQGHHVTVVDDLSTGSLDNLAQLGSHPKLRVSIDSVMNEPVMADLIGESDVVFHLAAAVGVKLIVEAPVRTIETNVQGTEIVLRQAARHNKMTVIFSTSEVYGKSTAVPFSEDADLVMGPTPKHRWAYACSKAIDEFLALAYHKERGLPVIIVRLFNTVGPRQTGRYGMVVPNFVGQALTGDSLRVFGDGTQSRCFCHVSDVVRALADLMERGEFYGEVFNIGATSEITIADLAGKVRDLVGSGGPITYVPYAEAYEEGFEDMQRRIPDISKIGRAIGWEPVKTLDDIILDVKADQMASEQFALAA
jgi:UDP-glucose 4-epimerase